jgi:transposase
VARLVEAIGRYRTGALSCVEAAEVLGMSERHFRRLRDRYEAEGAEGLLDRRRGRASGRRVAVDRIEWVLEQYRTRYFDFTAKHFHERLVAEGGFELGYTWTKLVLQRAGLIRPAAKRSAHRKKRPRRPLPGMMLFQDGSPHPWLAGRPPLDLVVTLDDATSEIYSAFLVEEEGTFSSLRGLAEVIGRHGLFSSLYTDRGSHYFVTPKAGGAVDRRQLTQVGRALAQLGIEHIPSYSPEARGRMERVFGTLQKRLPQELRLAGITGLEAANRFLAEHFVPAHNRRFAVAAAEAGSAFVPFVGELAETLCIQAERVVGNDNCVRYEGLSLQIPEHQHRYHFVKAKVRVHAYENGLLAVFHGPRCLARYQPDGHPLGQAPATSAA